MAASLPAKLRSPDIQRFNRRAAQLEKFRPIVTYWCEYYILQQILSKQLHTGDDECSNYAVQLMDKLENFKADNAANDAVVDDLAAKMYIENFALQTFNRADEAQRTNKVTAQTADTFQAASTFMDLLGIWGGGDQEILTKAKFAKFHAMRIVKAIKAGDDPNASNPVVEEHDPIGGDGIEDELKELENGAADSRTLVPSVEEVGDGRLSREAPASPADLPHTAVSNAAPPPDTVMPANIRQSSVGGGYFPSVTSAAPGQDIDMTNTGIRPESAPSPGLSISPEQMLHPQEFYSQNAPPPEPFDSAENPGLPMPSHMNAQPPAGSSPQPRFTAAPLPPSAPDPTAFAHTPAPIVHTVVGSFKDDDESTMAAQKHARWAISALNFEDVNTAVKELRLALESLGAA